MGFIQSLWDFIGLPFRLLLFDQKWLPLFGWTTLEEERVAAVLPFLEGRVLDIGAGNNPLINAYKNGVGVDVFDWGSGIIVVEDSANLPFENSSFDTVTFLACLNHIPNRSKTIIEAKRLLKPNGKIIVTMIDPILGGVGHILWWYSEDKKRGGMKEGELSGMWGNDIDKLMHESGFNIETHKRFVYGMNNIYIYKRNMTS
jgi:SAM-dependent methyltransferase